MDRFKRVAIITLAMLVLLTLTIPVLAQTPTPEMLPETGGTGVPWAAVVTGAGVIILAAGLALPLARRTR